MVNRPLPSVLPWPRNAVPPNAMFDWTGEFGTGAPAGVVTWTVTVPTGVKTTDTGTIWPSVATVLLMSTEIVPYGGGRYARIVNTPSGTSGIVIFPFASVPP